MDDNAKRDLVLYKRMKAGDDSARDALILNSRDLVEYHARKITFNAYVYDDLKSEGYLELIKCVDRWEFQGKEFKAYATKCVKFSMWVYLNRKYKFFNGIQTDDMIYIDHESCNFDDIIQLNYIDDAYNNVDCDQIYEYISDVLTKRQKEIMNLSYFDGLGPTEIAKKLGINTSNVTTTMKDARKRIQDNFDPQKLGIGV